MGYTLDEVRRSSIREPSPYFPPTKTPSPELSQRQFQVRRRSSLRQCLTPTDLQDVNYESVFDDDEKEVKDESHPPTPTKTSPSRRTSLGHQSLVGSYEESLLSGRMSASTSKTVPFHAGIGVLGKGGCNKLLRCPKQINMSFNAGFVVWEDIANTSSLVSATGSPYVGIISLTDYYQGRFAKREKRKMAQDGGPSERTKVKTFPGYRIPPVGQLQVVVSNLQKTAVKLFLIPYNVSEMPTGTRTFVRQKVYSASSSPGAKGTLVHAAHIPIVRLDNDKLYLCGDIRLVFQNRVLNGGAVDDKTSTSQEPTKDNTDFTKHYLGLGRSKDNMVIEEIMGGWSKLASEPSLS